MSKITAMRRQGRHPDRITWVEVNLPREVLVEVTRRAAASGVTQDEMLCMLATKQLKRLAEEREARGFVS